MKTYDFYLTNNGNVLNVRKECFQTINGEFLRHVFEKEMDFLKGVLTPVEFPEGIEETELPVWEYLWAPQTELGTALCFTRQKRGHKREYAVLYDPIIGGGSYYDIKIVDTDLDNLFVEDVDAYDCTYECDCVAELTNYAKMSNLLEVYSLGNYNLQARLRKYKILKEKGIKFPVQERMESYAERRKRKPKTVI